MRSFNSIQGALAVWISSYIFFLFTLVSNFSASHDSIHYLNDIVNGRELFHQHHLLYHFLASKWMSVFSQVPSHYAIESFTALWGSSALAIVYLFFTNRFHLLPVAAAMGTAVIAFSYGFWFYSVNIEVYLPPLFFILSALYVISAPEVKDSTVPKMALLHSLAMLFHQVNVLFVAIGIYFILCNRTKIKISTALLQYAFIGIVVAGGMYFIAGWVIEGHNSPMAWWHWMEGYTVGHGYWQGLSLKTPLHVLTGFSHAFVGGHFIFQLPGVEEYLQQAFSDHGLKDELFLSSKIKEWAAVLLTFLAGLLATGILTVSVRFMKKYKLVLIGQGAVVKPLLLTIGVYSAFFCFWMPEILEFWILQMVLIWILLIGTLPLVRLPFKIPLRVFLGLLLVLTFSVNYFGSIRWLQDINNDWYYRETENIKKYVSANDLVIIDNNWILKDFVRYYTKASVLATDEPGYNQASEDAAVKAAKARHGKVFLYKDSRFIRSY